MQIKINEVDDLLSRRQQPVREISGDAAEDQAKGELSQGCARLEVMPAEKQNEQRDKRDDGQQFVVSAKHAPGCAGVAPVNELEEAINHNLLLAFTQQTEHEELCELIEA